MARIYLVGDVQEMLGWNYPDDKMRHAKAYGRVYSAICLGCAGTCKRLRRGWVLTQSNVDKLLPYLRERWPDMLAKAQIPAQEHAAAAGS